MEILKDEFDSVIDRLLSCHVGVCTCESGTVSDDTLYSGHRKVVFTFTPVSVFALIPEFSEYHSGGSHSLYWWPLHDTTSRLRCLHALHTLYASKLM